MMYGSFKFQYPNEDNHTFFYQSPHSIHVVNNPKTSYKVEPFHQKFFYLMIESKNERQLSLHAKSKGIDTIPEHKVNIDDKKIKVKNDMNSEAHAIIKEALFSRTKRHNIIE